MNDERKSDKVRVVAFVLLAAASFCNMACSPQKGVYPAARYESDEISYFLPAVNEMKCSIEKGRVMEVPYHFGVALTYPLKEDQAPIEGVAYKHDAITFDSLMPRVRKIFKHGILVEMKLDEKSRAYRAFILTDRHYSFNDELALGYYIYGGFAIYNDGYSVKEYRAFREMDSAVVKKRGLDLKLKVAD